MLTVTHALIDYWKRLPFEPPAARRRRLDSLTERIRAAAERRDELLPFALGDVEDDIVAAATREYLHSAGAATRERHAALDDAIEWIRRSLALNRGAVFAELLSLEDESVTARLAPLRLGLSSSEMATACRSLAPRPGSPVAEFLSDWLELLDGSRLQAEHGIVCAALAAEACAKAA
jgi:hypothetical protein